MPPYSAGGSAHFRQRSCQEADIARKGMADVAGLLTPTSGHGTLSAHSRSPKVSWRHSIPFTAQCGARHGTCSGIVPGFYCPQQLLATGKHATSPKVAPRQSQETSSGNCRNVSRCLHRLGTTTHGGRAEPCNSGDPAESTLPIPPAKRHCPEHRRDQRFRYAHGQLDLRGEATRPSDAARSTAPSTYVRSIENAKAEKAA